MNWKIVADSSANLLAEAGAHRLCQLLHQRYPGCEPTVGLCGGTVQLLRGARRPAGGLRNLNEI